MPKCLQYPPGSGLTGYIAARCCSASCSAACSSACRCNRSWKRYRRAMEMGRSEKCKLCMKAPSLPASQLFSWPPAFPKQFRKWRVRAQMNSWGHLRNRFFSKPLGIAWQMRNQHCFETCTGSRNYPKCATRQSKFKIMRCLSCCFLYSSWQEERILLKDHCDSTWTRCTPETCQEIVLPPRLALQRPGTSWGFCM